MECGLSSMKFLGDMGISPRTIALLREQGYDAIHLVEQNLERMPDPNILDKARQEERILLTVDLDFAQLLAMSGERLPTYVQLWAAQVLAVALPRPWEKHLTPPSSVRISPSTVEQDWFRIISQLGTPSAPPNSWLFLWSQTWSISVSSSSSCCHKKTQISYFYT